MDIGTANAKIRDVFITGLRNQHSVEKQAIELLERQVERLENYPELSARMRQHIQESQRQAERLEELLVRYETSHSTLKDAVLSFVGNIAALTHAATQDEVLKNSLANYAFEHWEIASYKSLLTLADLAGDAQAPTALKQSLSEEVAMAEWIDAHLDPTVRRYVSLLQAERTAGV